MGGDPRQSPPGEPPDPSSWLSEFLKDGQAEVRDTDPRPVRHMKTAFNRLLANPRRRRTFAMVLRACLIVGMLGMATAAIYPELTTASAPAQDPMTHAQMLWIPYGNVSGISGLVSGDDMIEGNFTVVGPAGANVLFYIIQMNRTENYTEALPHALYTSNATTGMPIYFTAPYTAVFGFVFYNPHPDLVVEVYYRTVYMSSLPPA
jgi:hypothetical protein